MTYDIEKEKREAIDAGYRALNSLHAAEAEIRSARNWGLLDVLGGGFIVTMIKRSKMSNAQHYMEQAQYDLKAFSRELHDVQGFLDINLDVGDFLSFADYFFDGMIADWFVQSKIVKAKQQIQSAIERVQRIIAELEK